MSVRLTPHLPERRAKGSDDPTLGREPVVPTVAMAFRALSCQENDVRASVEPLRDPRSISSRRRGKPPMMLCSPAEPVFATSSTRTPTRPARASTASRRGCRRSPCKPIDVGGFDAHCSSPWWLWSSARSSGLGRAGAVCSCSGSGSPSGVDHFGPSRGRPANHGQRLTRRRSISDGGRQRLVWFATGDPFDTGENMFVTLFLEAVEQPEGEPVLTSKMGYHRQLAQNRTCAHAVLVLTE